MGKAATLIAEIYDPLGLEGSIICQSCENRWTDRHPSIYRLTWIFSPLLANGIHMPGEIFISTAFQIAESTAPFLLARAGSWRGTLLTPGLMVGFQVRRQSPGCCPCNQQQLRNLHPPLVHHLKLQQFCLYPKESSFSSLVLISTDIWNIQAYADKCVISSALHVLIDVEQCLFPGVAQV